MYNVTVALVNEASSAVKQVLILRSSVARTCN